MISTLQNCYPEEKDRTATTMDCTKLEAIVEMAKDVSVKSGKLMHTLYESVGLAMPVEAPVSSTAANGHYGAVHSGVQSAAWPPAVNPAAMQAPSAPDMPASQDPYVAKNPKEGFDPTSQAQGGFSYTGGK